MELLCVQWHARMWTDWIEIHSSSKIDVFLLDSRFLIICSQRQSSFAPHRPDCSSRVSIRTIRTTTKSRGSCGIKADPVCAHNITASDNPKEKNMTTGPAWNYVLRSASRFSAASAGAVGFATINGDSFPSLSPQTVTQCENKPQLKRRVRIKRLMLLMARLS